MSVYRRGDVWWYKFRFANRVIRESAKTASKTVSEDAEKKRRRELEEGFNNLADTREERIQSLSKVAADYLEAYKLKHRSGNVRRVFSPAHHPTSVQSDGGGHLGRDREAVSDDAPERKRSTEDDQ